MMIVKDVSSSHTCRNVYIIMLRGEEREAGFRIVYTGLAKQGTGQSLTGNISKILWWLPLCGGMRAEIIVISFIRSC